METMLQAAQRWVEWASDSISAQKWADAVYNLDQFDAIYSQEGYSDDLESLNARSQYLRSLLAERDMQTAGGGIFAPFRPDATRQAIESAAARSLKAAAAAAASAARAGAGADQTGRQAAIQGHEIPGESAAEIADAPNAYRDFLNLSMLGIPVWAWGIGALGIIFLMEKK